MLARTSCHARLSTLRYSSDAISRQPVSEVLNMRKKDEVFSDSLKTPIQDVLLVSVEQFAHRPPYPVLAIRDDTQLGLRLRPLCRKSA
jgi:hypothetical protein